MTVGADCPDSVIPHWQKRFGILQKEIGKFFNRHEEYREKNGAEILDLLAPKSSHGKSGLFKVKLDISKKKKSISYECKRVRRLRQPRAGAMLTKYAHYISRAAFEHDFGKLDKKENAE